MSISPILRDENMITIEQAKALSYGDRVYFVQMYKTVGSYFDSNGRARAVSAPIEGNKVREFRVSGRPKTWKTRPNDVKVPVKYGLYDNAYIGTVDDCEPLERFYLTEQEAMIELAPVLKGKIGTKKQIQALESAYHT